MIMLRAPGCWPAGRGRIGRAHTVRSGATPAAKGSCRPRLVSAPVQLLDPAGRPIEGPQRGLARQGCQGCQGCQGDVQAIGEIAGSGLLLGQREFQRNRERIEP